MPLNLEPYFQLINEVVETIMIDVEERFNLDLKDDRDYIKRIWGYEIDPLLEEFLKNNSKENK
jgi:hypothetical protein